MTETNIIDFPKAQRIGTPAPANRSTFADPRHIAASIFGLQLA
ncbi:hypothetical protein [Deinococcus marmoris]|nr:hypothetical protein [Deinococcus marmoris]